MNAAAVRVQGGGPRGAIRRAGQAERRACQVVGAKATEVGCELRRFSGGRDQEPLRCEAIADGLALAIE